MRITDFLYFLRQIFFPNWQPPIETEEDQDDEPGRLAVWLEAFAKKIRSKESVGVFVSILVHVVLILILSWLFLPVPKPWGGIDILGGFNLPKVLTQQQEPMKGEIDMPEIPMPQQAESAPEQESEVVTKIDAAESSVEVTKNDQQVTETTEHATEQSSAASAEKKVIGEFVGGGGFEGRTPEGRARALGVGDTSSRGENAVEAALQWIAAHQQPDGGWSFDFKNSCGLCGDVKMGKDADKQPKKHPSRIAATSLALLAFLGAGYTHQVPGPYKKTVEDGLVFLRIQASNPDSTGGFVPGGGKEKMMYSHGLATIVFCEAYAMSKPKTQILGKLAQDSLRFIENAQNRNDGGWRYAPSQPGDLSVTAWQVMALKSGKLAGLHVSQPVVYAANEFLDDVAWRGGREYRYVPDIRREGTGEDSPKTSSASGLLLRMYLGWEPGMVELDEGIDQVARWGPLKKSKDGDTICNLYYTYYATLALHHHDGSNWPRWNSEIQEFLIQTQSKRGHESGSWYFPDYYCDVGGRLLNTVLATLILETPYRIMPLFRK